MKKTEEVVIRNFEQLETKIRIVGNDPLIVHNWSEKAKKEMLDAQTFHQEKEADQNAESSRGNVFHWLAVVRVFDREHLR